MAQKKQIDVYGVGNALVDILVFVEDSFVEKLGFPKGSMNLVDTEKRTSILSELKLAELNLRGGGSAANSMFAVAMSGGSAAYAGKVSDDANGAFYIQDLENHGIRFDTTPATSVEPTGTSIILTTPDAERTMCTHLGISGALNASDIEPERVAQAQICYVEGYLWTGAPTKAAALQAMQAAAENGTRVSFTFSDAFLVEAFLEDFRKCVKEQCNVVFCNADEARRFIGDADLDRCVREIGSLVDTAFITDGAAGAWVCDRGTIEQVPGFRVNPVDTVGAGDAFAGGVLYALTHGYAPDQAARWGNFLASEVVKVQGPRLDPATIPDVRDVLN